MPTLRVLSYNIRSLRDDRAAVVRVIRACEPDVVCIQESPRFWRPRHQAAWLARGTGLYVISGGRAASGPLLLGKLRVTVRSVHDVILPRTPGLHRRGFATAVVTVGDSVPFSITSFHLSLDADERFAMCRKLIDHVAALAPHGIIGGDVNEQPDKPGWRLLADHWQDGYAVAPWGGEYTSVPRRPHQRIDAIFATPGIEMVSCGVPINLSRADLIAATDHLPVLAELRF